MAICSRYVRFGQCSKPDCRFSHHLSEFNQPLCIFYHRYGTCTRIKCLYSHIDIDGQAEICPDFASSGYCEQGYQCRKKHFRICPDFAKTSQCKKQGKCGLPHVLSSGKIANDDQQNDLNEDLDAYSQDNDELAFIPLLSSSESDSIDGVDNDIESSEEESPNDEIGHL